MPENERYNYFSMFTPEGKVIPIESIQRSVENGNVCVALRNKNTALMIAQRSGSEDPLAENRSKIERIDEFLVYTYSGITNDGIKIGARIRNTIQREKERTGTRLPFERIFSEMKFEYGLEVMRYGKRAMGIAGVIMGIDTNKVSLLQISPTGEVTSCLASCIGRRSQSARTILESKNVSLLQMSDKDLIKIGVEAFSNAVNDQSSLSDGAMDVCMVSLDTLKVESPPFSSLLNPQS
jgi:20S proteasome alpha/beta subunit